MTISMFEAFHARMPAVRADRMMDMGQSTIYAQVTAEGRTRIWNGWTQVKSQINHMMNLLDRTEESAKSVITWNGEPVDFDFVKKRFRGMFGRRAVQ